MKDKNFKAMVKVLRKINKKIDKMVKRKKDEITIDLRNVEPKIIKYNVEVALESSQKKHVKNGRYISWRLVTSTFDDTVRYIVVFNDDKPDVEHKIDTLLLLESTPSWY